MAMSEEDGTSTAKAASQKDGSFVAKAVTQKDGSFVAKAASQKDGTYVAKAAPQKDGTSMRATIGSDAGGTLTVVELLRSGALPLAELQSMGVVARQHAQHPQLVQLKYAVGRADMHDPVVQECRGLVLDREDGWRPVALPYRAFFNLREKHAADIDWATARVTPKLDGTLMMMFHYQATVGADGEWLVATASCPDASTVAEGCDISFRDLFWRIWHATGMGALPPNGMHHLCFVFELLAPETRVVVPVATASLTLHGVRDMRTLREEAPDSVAARMGWPCVATLPHLISATQVEAAAADISPLEGEGFVVTDVFFRRVKVKSRRYVLAAHLPRQHWGWAHLQGKVVAAIASDAMEITSVHDRQVARLVLQGETSEFCSYFPQWASRFRAVAAILRKSIAVMEELVHEARVQGLTARQLHQRLPRADPRLRLLTDVLAGRTSSVAAGLATLTDRRLLDVLAFREEEEEHEEGSEAPKPPL